MRWSWPSVQYATPRVAPPRPAGGAPGGFAAGGVPRPLSDAPVAGLGAGGGVRCGGGWNQTTFPVAGGGAATLPAAGLIYTKPPPLTGRVFLLLGALGVLEASAHP